MNKRLLTLSMVGLLTVTLASCSDVKRETVDGKQVIVTVGDEKYTADDLLAKYGETSSGVDAYYKAIYDVLIRNEKDLITDDLTKSVSSDIDSFTKGVKSNASSNGKTYKAELSDELKEKGVESLAELSELYTLEKQKTKYEENWYTNRIDYEHSADQLTQDYISTSTPYHVRHILVKTESAGTSLYSGTISEAEALKLSSVIERLAADNESFGQVAQQASDDTGSAALYGSIGIVDQGSKSGFVSEFKYGVYAYDAIYDTHSAHDAVSNDERIAKLNIPETISYNSSITGAAVSYNVKDAISSIGLVPYTAVENLREYADKTKTENNLTYVPDAASWNGLTTPASLSSRAGQVIDENYYPRNIIFNNYFNDHGLYVITKDGYTGTSTRFKSFEGFAGGKEVLCDEKGNPILVTRGGSGDSYQGIHFMIIEQSPFWYDDAKLDYTIFKGKEAPSTADYLRYYYSTNIPTTSSEDVSENQKYVTYIKTNRNDYSDRADDIEAAVKGYDSNISYTIFEDLLKANEGKVTIDETILKSITDMIETKKASTKYTNEQSNIASWKSYVELLTLQDAEKAVKQISLDYISMYDSSYAITTVASSSK